MSTNITIAPVLVDKLPQFVQDLYPKFVQFMRDYIDFLEQDENFLRVILDWEHNLEPSNNVEPYIDQLLKDLGFESGQNLAVSKSTMLHLLRDFYLARGSEASFKFLFRALFNESVEIRYPREQMLIPSYASYGERHFIFTTSENRGTESFQALLNYIRENGGTVTGLSSGVVAAIEDITTLHGAGTPYLRIEILQPTFEFEVGEVVVIQGGDLSVGELIKPVLKINIIDGGHGYNLTDSVQVVGASLQGQAVIEGVSKGSITGIKLPSPPGFEVGDYIRSDSHDGGFGFSAYVDSVDADGRILTYRITNKGYNYANIPELFVPGKTAKLEGTSTEIGAISKINVTSPFVDFSNVTLSVASPTGTDVQLQPEIVSRWSYNDWTDHRGFIAENSTLIDSDKYQQYSYTIVSSVSANKYNRFVDELLHPAGYIKTSSYEIVSHVNLQLIAGDIEIAESVQVVIPESIYTPTFNSGLDVETMVMIVTNNLDPIVTNANSHIVVS